MKTNPLLKASELGQSLWLDQMKRSLVTSGELARLIREDGLRGLTSNPTIFEKAIGESNDYADALSKLARSGSSTQQIYEALVIEDIGSACDLFAEVHRNTKGQDGFASLEVSPLLAHDTPGTIAEAKSLFARLARPNVMIKVPATPAGIPAIEELIAAGLNINVTLIFSVEVYEQVADAYIRGLERRAATGQPVAGIASVASFFVSRIDTAVDKQLNAKLAAATDAAQRERIEGLLGKAAIANAKLAYASFKRIFGSPRFAALAGKGARVQRPLWASTSTKNPKYRDVMYVEALIGADTVDTLPPATLEAFRDHGNVAPALEHDMQSAPAVFAALKSLGVDFTAVTDQLTADGVKSFAESFQQLMAVIESRREEVVDGIVQRRCAHLGGYEARTNEAIETLAQKKFADRIGQHDATLWKSEPEHRKIIENALGWLSVPELMGQKLTELEAFAAEVRDAGFQHAVVLGMGGSSLCPEVFRQTFGKRDGWPELHVLDSTVPASIRRLEQHIQVEHTLFIVASKSGTTTEPQMFQRYFFDRVKQNSAQPGRNFVAITDPGTALQREAEGNGFRRVFLNPPDIGGRYSALSYFGLVPLAVMGGDVRTLLARAQKAVQACGANTPAGENPGLTLGAALGTLYAAGRDKLTLIASSPVDSLGLWIEQLIAESTGKEGKGIVPIACEPLGTPADYGNDRVFCCIHTRGGSDAEEHLAALERAGHPVLRQVLRDALDLGEEFFVWEFATAVAGSLMGIDAFDQPNVQESKDNTKRLLGEFTQRGSLPEQPQITAESDMRAFADETNAAALRNGKPSIADLLHAHLRRVQAGDYVALTEYIEESPRYDELLQQLRVAIRSATGAATTTGYGPRFLHSTGQLHKGGADNGVFIQITARDAQDLAIPGERYGFSVLKQAQALGDYESLAKRKRRAIRIDLGQDVEAGLRRLLEIVQHAPEAVGEISARR